MQPQWICPLIVVFLIVVFAVRIRRLDASFAVRAVLLPRSRSISRSWPAVCFVLDSDRGIVAVPTMPRVGSP